MSVMIYKYPHTMKVPVEVSKKKFDYQVVSEEESKELLAKGWYDDPVKAIDSFNASKDADKDNSGYTSKKELQEYAQSLGIKIDKRWSMKKLESAISEKVEQDGL